MPAPSGFDHVSTTKSNSTRSIAAHPCKQRKDGAPSVGMVHAKIVEGGPSAKLHQEGYMYASIKCIQVHHLCRGRCGHGSCVQMTGSMPRSLR